MISRTLAARYAELKQEVPGCLLLMQVGAFMQVLDADARTVSGVTGGGGGRPRESALDSGVAAPRAHHARDGVGKPQSAARNRPRCACPSGSSSGISGKAAWPGK